MSILLFIIEIFFVYLLFGAFKRLLHRSFKNHWLEWQMMPESFAPSIGRVLRLIFLSFGWEQSISIAFTSGSLREWTRRLMGFNLALSNLAWGIPYVVMFGLSIGLASLGFFGDLPRAFQGFPFSWIFISLSSGGWAGISSGFIFGMVFTLLLKKSGIGAICGAAFIYSFLISVPAAFFLILGELFGLWLLALWNWRNHSFRRDLYFRTCCFVLTALIFGIFGKSLYDFLGTQLLGYSALSQRLFMWNCLIFGFLAIDTIISLLILHFLYQKPEDQILEAGWPSSLLTKSWLPHWSIEKWRKKALERKATLIRQTDSMTVEEKSQMPASLFEKLKLESQAMDGFLLSAQSSQRDPQKGI